MSAPTIKRFAVGDRVIVRLAPDQGESPEATEKRGLYKALLPGTYLVLEDVSNSGENQVVHLGHLNDSGPVMIQFGQDSPEPLKISADWLAPVS